MNKEKVIRFEKVLGEKIDKTDLEEIENNLICFSEIICKWREKNEIHIRN